MHRDAGQTRAQAIRSALREIRTPLIGSTITPIVVFLPLVAIAGVTGVFFRALALTVAIALLTSLALALTWTPTLSHYFIRRHGRGGSHHDEDPTAGFLGGVVRLYDRVIRFAIARPLALAGAGVVFIAGVLLLLSGAGDRSAAGDGRGRLHHRLHHAGGLVAPGNESSNFAGGRHSSLDP